MAFMDDFEHSYLSNVLADTASEDEGNIPAALASAAYGYTRGAQFSPLVAGVFGFFGYQYPLLSTLLYAVDAVFIQETPAKRAVSDWHAEHGESVLKKLGLSGVSYRRLPRQSCRSGYRRRGGVCIRRRRR